MSEALLSQAGVLAGLAAGTAGLAAAWLATRRLALRSRRAADDRPFLPARELAPTRRIRSGIQPGFRASALEPPGPILGHTYLGERDLRTLGDLCRLYPLPPGHEYALTWTGQPVVAREDGALFSFVVEDGLLTFDLKVSETCYETIEVQRAGASDGGEAAGAARPFGEVA